MVATLPVPIEFRLPEGWRSAPPDELGAPGSAFVAVYPRADRGFTANITIDGAEALGGSLAELADASVDSLRASAARVTVTDRCSIGSAESPALTQTLGLRTEVNGLLRDLVQVQVYLALGAAPVPSGPALVRLVLTVTAEEFAVVLADFQYLVWTLRPESARFGTRMEDTVGRPPANGSADPARQPAQLTPRASRLS
jgi:hypothetical protein